MAHPSPPFLTAASPAASLSRPSPLPSSSLLAPPAARTPRPPTQGAPSARTSGGGIHIEDPSTEATRALGVLLGAGGGEGGGGLLERVERDVEALFESYERAFDERGPAGTDPQQALASLTALLSLLSRSSLGGFVPPAPPSSDLPLPPPTLGQADVDAASTRAQALFKEVQRVREGGEVARVGLTG
ncbi:hypothetical protein JCM8097_004467 [Rhodosporidiobolus ruineniae]